MSTPLHGALSILGIGKKMHRSKTAEKIVRAVSCCPPFLDQSRFCNARTYYPLAWICHSPPVVSTILIAPFGSRSTRMGNFHWDQPVKIDETRLAHDLWECLPQPWHHWLRSFSAQASCELIWCSSPLNRDISFSYIWPFEDSSQQQRKCCQLRLHGVYYARFDKATSSI